MWLQIVAVVVLLGLLLFCLGFVMKQICTPSPEEQDDEPTETEAAYDAIGESRRAAMAADAKIAQAMYGPHRESSEL